MRWLCKHAIVSASVLVLGLAVIPLFKHAQAEYKCGEGDPLKNTVWGCCPKNPIPNMATPCESPLDYFKYNTLADFADEQGMPKWCQTIGGSGSAARGLNHPSGAGLAGSSACKMRIVADDDLAENGGGIREAAYPPIIDKGEDGCLWRHELALHVTNTALGGMRNDEYGSGAQQVYGGSEDKVCLNTASTPNTTAELIDSHTGEHAQPGKIAAYNAVRSLVDPDFERVDGFANGWENAGPIIQEASYKSEGHPYDRSQANGNTIASAYDRLFLQTPSYANYDPSAYRPGQEMKLANELRAKTPLQVAKLKEDMQMDWLNGQYAYAAGGLSGDDTRGIICAVAPRVCEMGAHFDDPAKVPYGHEEAFLARFPRDNKISTPNVQFLPDVKERFKGMLGDTLRDLAGDQLGNLLEKLSGTSPQPMPSEPLQRGELVQCLNAMASSSQGGDLMAKMGEQRIASACSDSLLSCLQAQGGYSMNNLNSCYIALNEPTVTGTTTSTNGQVMNEVQRFLFNNNASVNYSGLSANNLADLGGANLNQLNRILMQKIAGLTGLGMLEPTDGQFMGNKGKLPKLIQDLKTRTTAQWMDGTHLFPMRSALTMASERDMYSACAFQKTCRVGPKATPISFWDPFQGPLAPGRPIAQADEPSNQKKAGISLVGDAHAQIGVSDGDLYFQELYDLRKSGKPRDLKKEQEIINKLCSDSDPKNLLNSPCPSHKAIGMPETTDETGALMFREDGSTYYANMPDKTLDFKVKPLYTVQDAESGMLPESFAEVLPKDADHPFSQLAALVNEDGTIRHVSRQKIEKAVAELNGQFKQTGSNIRITSDVIIGGLLDYTRLQNRTEAEKKSDSVQSILASVGISDANASVMSSSAAVAPRIPQHRNNVYCAGKATFDQHLVDVIEPRYTRFNSQTLMRMFMNRWWKAEEPCSKPCSPLCGVCAPKPCDPQFPQGGWNLKCWNNKATSCLPPYGGKHPIAAISYDHGSILNDIGYGKPINKRCAREDTPEGKPKSSSCHSYKPGCGTRAYNCAVYPNGKRYCATTWAHHPDIQYILDYVWKRTTGGDFDSTVGENSMEDVCHMLAKPMPMVNRVPMGSVEDAFKQGIQLPEGSTFAQYFGKRRPYPVIDSIRNAFGAKPGQREDYSKATGAMVAMMTIDSDKSLVINEKYAGMAFTPQDSYYARRERGLISDAQAAARAPAGVSMASNANKGSAMPCFGGDGGHKGGSCPVAGFDPQSTNMEALLSQARTYRRIGMNCMPDPALFPHLLSEEVFVAETLGAPVTAALENVEGGIKAGFTRSMTYPISCPGGGHNPDPNLALGYFNPDQFDRKKGFDSVLELGAEAGGAVIMMPQCGGKGKERGVKCYGVVTAVNKDKGYIDVLTTNTGRFYDNSMINEGGGRRLARRIYLKDKMPERTGAIIEKVDYPTDACSMPANQLQTCVNYNPDDMEVFILKDPNNGEYARSAPEKGPLM